MACLHFSDPTVLNLQDKALQFETELYYELELLDGGASDFHVNRRFVFRVDRMFGEFEINDFFRSLL